MKRRPAQHLFLPCARAIALASLPLLCGAQAAGAQQTISRPVVQPLPPPASADLSAALRRLAADSRDFQALIDAGKASLKLNDVDAALGFFGRADAVRSGDPQVKAGLAAAYLRSDKPIEALQLFAEAERGGAIDTQAMADRGLAYDLVGDNAAAQAQYRAALAHGQDTETIMRLALSQAIAGDKPGFEATLLPLLQQRSLPAYRARAFGLAILGEEKEAVSIAQAVMPRDLADRVAPYLGYMPKLTHAQQAAAANMGVFPRAAQIGRDDPRIAAYAGTPGYQSADSRLTPQGRPLGPSKPVDDSRSQRRRPDRGSSTTANTRVAQAPASWATARPSLPPARIAAERDADRPPAPAARPAAGGELPPKAAPVTVTAVPVVQQTPSRPPVVASAPARVELPPAAATPPPPSPPPVTLAVNTPPPAATPGFDLARVGTGASVALPGEAAASEPASVADAFADIKLPTADPAQASRGAVDITKIDVPREVAKPPEPPKAAPPPPPPAKPKPKKAVVPSRHWVQVATGRNVKALAFDWRRFGKKAPALLGKRDAFTAEWGQTRRLLTGPFDSDKAADKFVAELKKAGIDSFSFTSDEGEEVAPLK